VNGFALRQTGELPGETVSTLLNRAGPVRFALTVSENAIELSVYVKPLCKSGLLHSSVFYVMVSWKLFVPYYLHAAKNT